MWRTKTRIFLTALLLCLGLFLLLQPVDSAWGLHYNPCRVPPIVSASEKPNVMILMDLSGSMQFSPYWPYVNYQLDYSLHTYDLYYNDNPSYRVSPEYNPLDNYYGYFDSTLYYVYRDTGDGTDDDPGDYFEEIIMAQAPDTNSVKNSIKSYSLKEVSVWSESSGQGVTFYWAEFRIADGEPNLDLQTGDNADCIVFHHLDRYGEIFNNLGWEVIEVSSDKRVFRIGFSPSREGPPSETRTDDEGQTVIFESCSGEVSTRVLGNFTEGISGNLLNWAAMSRIDNTLMALIGGKTSHCTDDSCFLRAQGCRRYATELSNIHADFFVRPGDWTSTTEYDTDTWSSGANYPDKWTFLSVSTHYAGDLSSQDTDAFSWSGHNAEVWSFTLTRAAKIIIEMQSTEVDCYLRLYTNKSVPSGSPNYTNDDGAAGTNARLTLNLPAGTYCIEATTYYSDQSGSYTLIVNADLQWNTTTYPYHDGQALSTIGSVPFARVVLKKDADARRGIVQDTFDHVRYGFAYFNTDGSNEGKIAVGCDNTSLDTLLNALQGKTSSFSGIFPWYGTPTGEAVWAMRGYYRQASDSHGNVSNSSFINKGGTVDPYYSGAGLTPCRKSFVVLLSDGAWNGSYDPMDPAYDMHVNDQRSDIALDQTITFYTIYSYSTNEEAQNSMKEVAMYGGFKDRPNDTEDPKYPYTARGTSLPSSSLNLDWPLKLCCKCTTGSWCTSGDCCPLQHGADTSWCGPNGVYNTDKCSEWAFRVEDVQDIHEEGGTWRAKTTVYGLPRNYYFSSDGSAIAEVLTRILEEIESPHAAAGAVATVSQEIMGQDIILRAVFQAVEETKPEVSLWYGHLEAYSPFKVRDEYKYAFELCCRSGKLCYQASGSPCSGEDATDCPSEKRCWDGAEGLRTKRGDVWSWLDDNGNGVVDTGEFKLFSASNASTFLSELGLGVENDCDDDGQYQNDVQDAASLINWVLGQQVSCYRDRTDGAGLRWLLGDIVYSTPVIVGVPPLGAVSTNDPDVEAYWAYRNSVLAQMNTAPGTTPGQVNEVIKKVVYAGANDGMLHAFVMGVWNWDEQKWEYERIDNHTYAQYVGDELWSFVPSNAVSVLKILADKSYGNTGCTHRNTVDLSAHAWQVFIDHNGDRTREWRTVILGGEREGGDVYFAIDVTDPDNPVLLWEFSVLKDMVRLGGGSQPPPCDTEWDYNANYRCYHWRYDMKERWCDRCCPSPSRRYRNWCRQRDRRCCYPSNDCDCCLCEETPPQTVTGFEVAGFRAMYDDVKNLPTSWSKPSVGRLNLPDSATVKFYTGDPDSDGSPTGVFNPSTGRKRHIAFIGGGFRVFDQQIGTIADADLELLRNPYFMAIDVETGKNLFRYVWPYIRTILPSGSDDPFPAEIRGPNSEYRIPYAMSDPVALDVMNVENMSQAQVQDCESGGTECKATGSDGFIDRVYVGDLNGNLYGFKFNFNDYATKKGIWVDRWLTKGVDESADWPWSLFRSQTQPMTVQPVASLDRNDGNKLRVVFGAGKYDDVITGDDDKTDPLKTSIYNLLDPITLPDLTLTTAPDPAEVLGGQIIEDSGLYVYIYPRCGPANLSSRLAKFYNSQTDSDDRTCTWVREFDWTVNGQPTAVKAGDCCEKTSAQCEENRTNPCWDCVLDLLLPDSGDAHQEAEAQTGDPGERVTNKGLIAGGLFFVTSYVPNADPCKYLGSGYLYILDYACQAFPEGFDPLNDPRFTAVYFLVPGDSSDPPAKYGLRLSLGQGLPSNPVLDSSGEHVIIQMSTGEILRIGVKLLEDPVNLRGWREEEQGD